MSEPELRWSSWTMGRGCVGGGLSCGCSGHLKPASAFTAQTDRNSSFLPVLSPISLCEGPLDLLTPLLPPNSSLDISRGGSFPTLVPDGPCSTPYPSALGLLCSPSWLSLPSMWEWFLLLLFTLTVPSYFFCLCRIHARRNIK